MVLVAAVAGGLAILGVVLPAMHNAKVEAVAIGEEAGRVMWRVAAFYEAHGRLPSGVGELRLPGTASREYRLHESDASRRIELAYAVSGGRVTIQHESGKATFVPVLEERKLARWQLKENTYSESARGPIEFGAMTAVRCLREPALQPLPECARFLPAREAFALFIGADPKDADTIREGFARRFPPDSDFNLVADAAPRVLRGTQCTQYHPAEYVCRYSFEQDAGRRALYSVMFALDAGGTRVKGIAVSRGF